MAGPPLVARSSSSTRRRSLPRATIYRIESSGRLILLCSSDPAAPWPLRRHH